jgi:ankyrin repeat protein
MFNAAVGAGHRILIEKIRRHPRFSKMLTDYRSAVFRAMKANNLSLFRDVLSEIGGDVNIRNRQRSSLIVEACHLNLLDLVNEIVSSETFDHSAVARVLSLSMQTSHHILDRLSKLPAADLNVVILDPDTGTLTKVDPHGPTTVLGLAIRRRKWKLVRKLLKLPGVDPLARDPLGRTILYEALLVLHAHATRVLDIHGLDVNAQDSSGATLLHKAVTTKLCLPIISLVWRGSDLNVRDQKGQTPWELAHASKGPVPPQPDDWG